MTDDGDVCTVPFRVRFDEAAPDGLVRTPTLLRSAQDLAVSAAWSRAGMTYGQRSGLSEGRQCAAQIILAAAHGKRPELADAAGVGLVPSGEEFAFDISTLQPAQDSDWTEYFAASAPRAAAQ